MFTPELLGIAEDDFLEFNKKIGSDQTATDFDYNGNDLQWVSLVFEDGLESFNVNVLSQENINILEENDKCSK
jgi:hypothetical protein